MINIQSNRQDPHLTPELEAPWSGGRTLLKVELHAAEKYITLCPTVLWKNKNNKDGYIIHQDMYCSLKRVCTFRVIYLLHIFFGVGYHLEPSNHQWL